MWHEAGLINTQLARNAATHNPFRWDDISTLKSYAYEPKSVILKTPSSHIRYDSVQDLLDKLEEILSAAGGEDLIICDKCKSIIDTGEADEQEVILKSILQTIKYDETTFMRDYLTLYSDIGKSPPTNKNKLQDLVKAIIDERFIKLVKQYLSIADWNIYEFYKNGYIKACYNDIMGGTRWDDLQKPLDPEESNRFRDELDNDRVIHIYKKNLALNDNIIPPWSNEDTHCQICLTPAERRRRHHCRWCGLFVCDGCLLIINDEKARHPKIKDEKPNKYFCKDFCAEEGLKNIFKRKMESYLLEYPQIRIFLKTSYLKNRHTTNNSELSKILLNNILSNDSNNLFTSELSKSNLPSFDNINLSQGNTIYRDHPVYEKFYSGLRMMMADFLKNQFSTKLQTKKTQLQNQELLKTDFQNNVLAVCGFLKTHQSLTHQVTSGYFGEPDAFFLLMNKYVL